MAYAEGCEHDVVTPRLEHSEPITTEGHADLLSDRCSKCGATVIGLDVGRGVRVWIAVAVIVRRQRGYQRGLLRSGPVQPGEGNPDLVSSLAGGREPLVAGAE